MSIVHTSGAKFATDTCELVYHHVGRDFGKACSWLLGVVNDAEALKESGGAENEAALWRLERAGGATAEAVKLLPLSRAELIRKCKQKGLPIDTCRETMDLVLLLSGHGQYAKRRELGHRDIEASPPIRTVSPLCLPLPSPSDLSAAQIQLGAGGEGVTGVVGFLQSMFPGRRKRMSGKPVTM